MSILSVHIEDVTAVAELHTEIPMEKLYDAADQAAYGTENSKGVVYRMRELNAVALIFPTGKVVCTGARSVRDAEEATMKAIEKVKEIGADVPSHPEIRIEKIVAAFRLAGGIDLRKAASSLEGSRYDSSSFPAVIFREPETSCEFIIREDGKVICTGAASIKDIQASFRRLTDRLSKAGIKADLA
jgi:transcription initiation factor TFIID TATA-box-binding protein